MVTVSGFDLVKFATLESTQTYLRKHIKKICQNTVVIAKNQSQGVGRCNTAWLCFEGCLCFSIAYKKDLKYDFQKHVLGCICDILVKQYNIDVFIKWPNDIFVQCRKVCGVLIDRVDEYYLIGIGINLRGQNEVYKSIKQLSNCEIDDDAFLESFLAKLQCEEKPLDYYKFSDKIYFDNKELQFCIVKGGNLILEDTDRVQYTFNENDYSYDIKECKICKK